MARASLVQLFQVCDTYFELFTLQNAWFDINFQLLEACEIIQIGPLNINLPLFGRLKGYSIFFLPCECAH